jgi:hypothetical protein
MKSFKVICKVAPLKKIYCCHILHLNFKCSLFRKLHQSVRDTLNERVNRLKKEKEDLGLQVDDLKRKNEVIQESIKQKIKGSVCSWA